MGKSLLSHYDEHYRGILAHHKTRTDCKRKPNISHRQFPYNYIVVIWKKRPPQRGSNCKFQEILQLKSPFFHLGLMLEILNMPRYQDLYPKRLHFLNYTKVMCIKNFELFKTITG